MLQRALLLAVVAGCGVEVGSGGSAPDAATDAPPVPIADAAIDARPCTGGDAQMAGNGSCFLLFTTPATFSAAQATCLAIGSHLAILRDAQDDLIARTLAGTRDVFIGLADQATEGTFTWIDGTPLVYSNWNQLEPNDGAGMYPEDCAVVNGMRQGQWDDRPCAPGADVISGAYAYLCQF